MRATRPRRKPTTAKAETAEQLRPPKIPDRLRAFARQPRVKKVDVEPFIVATHPPSVMRELTDRKLPSMAMDEDLREVGGWAQAAFMAQNAIFSAFAEGTTFLGYAYLAVLAQRAEYRVPSEIIATECTREWIEFASASDDEGQAKKIRELEDELEKFQVKRITGATVYGDGLFGRGHIYVDTGDDRDPAELASSIGDGRNEASKTKIKKGSIKAFKSVEAVWAYPTDYNSNDPLKPDWYRPNIWHVMSKDVHRTRFLTLIGREVPDLLKPAYSFGGLSLSQMIKPYVDNWLGTRQSIADLIRAFTVWIVHTNMNARLSVGGEDLIERVDLFNNLRDNHGAAVVDKDTEEISNVSAPLGSLDALQAQSQEHMCLSGDTLIETRRGQIQIRDVLINDEVMTRCGWAPVVWSGITGHAKMLVEVRTSNSTIKATECHPIYLSTTGGFVPAQNVKRGDRLLEARMWPISMASRFCGVAGGGVLQRPDIIATSKVVVYSTTSYGRRIAGLSRRVSSFITLMRIPLITNSIIWSLRPAPSTIPIISTVGAWGSTDTMWSTEKSASFVGLITRRHTRGKASIAVVTVGSTLRGIAKEVCGSAMDTLRTVSSAVLRFVLPLRQKDGSIAARSASVSITTVESVRKLRADEPVYNLEVAVGYLPEFFANGVLVHNSGVTRIPLVKLFGISPHGLNASSEGEIRAFYDWIKAFQEHLIRVPLTTIIDFVQLHLWGEIDQDITWKFKDLWQLDEAGRVAIQKTKADVHDAYLAEGVVSPQEVREAVAADKDSPYAGLDLDPEELPEAPQEPGMVGEDPNATAEGEVDPEVKDPQNRLATSITNRAANVGGASGEGFRAT